MPCKAVSVEMTLWLKSNSIYDTRHAVNKSTKVMWTHLRSLCEQCLTFFQEAQNFLRPDQSVSNPSISFLTLLGLSSSFRRKSFPVGCWNPTPSHSHVVLLPLSTPALNDPILVHFQRACLCKSPLERCLWIHTGSERVILTHRVGFNKRSSQATLVPRLQMYWGYLGR